MERGCFLGTAKQIFGHSQKQKICQKAEGAKENKMENAGAVEKQEREKQCVLCVKDLW